MVLPWHILLDSFLLLIYLYLVIKSISHSVLNLQLWDDPKQLISVHCWRCLACNIQSKQTLNERRKKNGEIGVMLYLCLSLNGRNQSSSLKEINGRIRLGNYWCQKSTTADFYHYWTNSNDYNRRPGRVAQSVTCLAADTCLIADPGIDPGPVLYFRGDWSWNNFYGLSPPFRWFKKGCCQLQAKVCYVHEELVNCLVKLAKKKVWLGELTVPIWPSLLTGT